MQRDVQLAAPGSSQAGFEHRGVGARKTRVAFPDFSEFFRCLGACTLFHMQPSYAQLRHQRAGIGRQFCVQFPLRSLKVMPVEQDKTVTGMRAGRNAGKSKHLFIGFFSLNESQLFRECFRGQHLHIGRVPVPAQKNTGTGFDLLQTAHAQVIPGVGVSWLQLSGSGVCGAGQAGVSDSGIGLSQAKLNFNVARFQQCGLLEMWDSLAESFQLYVFESKK